MKLTKIFKDLVLEMEETINQKFHNIQGVMVGCSGGADSTALFQLLCEITKHKKNFSVGILHINYGLRGKESDLDEEFVRELAKTKNCQLMVRKPADYGADFNQRCGQSVQEWARSIRRQFFEDVAAQGFAVGLAHHRDDLAENILMRLSRGSAPHNLLGMSTWRAPFWRPLLGVAKQDLLDLLGINSLSHRNDTSNDRMDYTRNIVRNRVLPELEKLYPGAAKRIVACASEARDISNHCRESVKTNSSSDSASDGLSLRLLRSLNRSVGMLVLRDFFSLSVGTQKHISREFLLQTLAWATSVADDHTGVFQDMRGGFRVMAEDGVIKLTKIAPHSRAQGAKSRDFGVYAVDEVTL